MALSIIQDPNNELKCVFCNSEQLDEVNMGPMYSCEDVVTHYFCMLFSSGLSQKGHTDKEGILGFLPQDIWKEYRRGQRLKCTFCHKNGAAIGCCKKSCKMMYHFRCGLENNIQFQFLKNYKTFCPAHCEPHEFCVPDNEWNCPICMCDVDKTEDFTVGTCCKHTVYHKECLKRMALNAGYFFKCPLCNAIKSFTTEMRFNGIFVPEQDASWEKEPDAFQDQYFQYSTCDAEICLCPSGKKFFSETGDFMMARCRMCGAAALHRKCGNLKAVDNWDCEACLLVIQKAGLTNNSSMSASSAGPSSLVTGSMMPSSDMVDISKLRIQKPAKNYFPYPKDQLRKYEQNKVDVLPDWRGLTLRVNIVDWINASGVQINK